MTLILGFGNHKGGVGKTTSTVNLGVALARQKKSVLVIDACSQADLTKALLPAETKIKATLYELFFNISSLSDAIIPSISESVDMIPAWGPLDDRSLDDIDYAFLTKKNGNEMMRNILKNDIVQNYDYVLIDAPPKLGSLVANVVVAADMIIVPVHFYYGYADMMDFLDIAFDLKDALNPELDVKFLLTNYVARSNLCKALEERLKTDYPGDLFKTAISQNISLAEAPMYGKSIFEYKPSSKGAEDYTALAKELIKMERDD